MINLPYNDILKMIQDKTQLSEDEITSKINDKLNQLSGLISREGAAHIIANELGVQLLPKEGERVQIKNILAGMRNVETLGRVQQVYEIREFTSQKGPGKVASFLLGDETGLIRVVLWNDQIDLLNKFKQGDTLRISGATSRDNNGRKELHLNDNSKVEINPEGEKVTEVRQREQADRKKISELGANDNVEILGTIVQVFDIRFFEVDPNTGRRIKPNENNEFIDAQGNSVTPAYSYVFNLFVDDGTSNIRVVCFKNQLERLLNKQNSEILRYKDSPTDFEPVKHDLLGHIVKIQGRVVNNEMFNRLEMISNLVFVDPDPEEEINRLKSGVQEVKKEPVITETKPNGEPEAEEQPEEAEVKAEETEQKPEVKISEVEPKAEESSESGDEPSTEVEEIDDSFFEGSPDKDDGEEQKEAASDDQSKAEIPDEEEEQKKDTFNELEDIETEDVDDIFDEELK